MKQSSKPTAKPARKRRAKPLSRRAVAAKRLKKTRTKLKKAVRTRRKQLAKYKRRSMKRLSKVTRRSPAKSKKAKKAVPVRKQAAKKPKTSPKKKTKAKVYPARALLATVVASGVIGAFGGHLWAQEGGVFGSDSSKKTAASSKITSYGPTQQTPGFSTYPTWAQDFSRGSGQPDSNYWNIYKGAPQNDNEEAQFYTANAENVHIGNGALSLTATKQRQPQGYQYASARIDTENKLSFTYGRVDVTAKLPSGAGTWPAIWLLPANNKYADLSPSGDPLRYINGGELDIAEAVGINPNIVYGVVHTHSDLKNPDHLGNFNQITVPGNDTGYNKYSLLWTPTSVTYEVNNTPFFTYTKNPGADYTSWPFDQPFFLILNLALGGKWAGQNTVDFPGNGIDNSALPASLDIKSVYYYPYIGQR